MIMIAFQSPRAIIAPDWEFDFSLDNFAEIFDTDAVFGTQVVNSLVLVLAATALTLVISAFASYSLSQLHWSRRTVLVVLTLAGLLQVIPPMTLVPGLYVTLLNYDLVGTLGGLILLNTVFNLPFAVIMTKFYFDTIPGELRESASIDGAGELRVFRAVMLPLAAPGIAAVAIFTAIQVWNEFLFGLVFTAGGREAPITVGIAALIQPQEIKFGAMAAVGVVTAVPIVLLAVVANRQIVAGLTRGAVKG
ncbi:carbohydrate ABC transporter permease [Jiangella aurantiaca]|uniref:Carbohydrate ABC transporter permease n=2 Tax=Jiangella aurantiaca TaxID=2530373 RepID=A0A4V2YSR9_9ACTN|nr:carbohydrate ABC transporter permease [Jiangella aurantiaca]